MMLETIRYRDEVRKADEYFEDIDAVKVGKDELKLIEQLIKQKKTEFKPDKFHDHYREALQELIDAKRDNREPEYEKEAPQGKVVNLMDALKKSLGGASKSLAKDKKTPAKKVPAKKAATAKEEAPNKPAALAKKKVVLKKKK